MLTLATKTAVPLVAATGLFERLAGMTYKVEKKDPVSNSGDRQIFKTQTFPVSSNVDIVNCFEMGRYRQLIPNSALRSMGYFECIQPVQKFKASDIKSRFAKGVKKSRQVYKGVLRFIYIANVAKMNFNGTKSNEADVGAIIEQALINTLDEKILDIQDDIFTQCQVLFQMKGEVKKDHKIVFPYTYDGLNLSVLNLYPMNFGAIDFDVYLFINPNCIQSITVGTAVDCQII